jgi:hypothetical protein
MALRFLWNATRGHRFTPWRSEYLKWRIETYSGRKADTIDARYFWWFLWKEKSQLIRFLGWTKNFGMRSGQSIFLLFLLPFLLHAAQTTSPNPTIRVQTSEVLVPTRTFNYWIMAFPNSFMSMMTSTASRFQLWSPSRRAAWLLSNSRKSIALLP